MIMRFGDRNISANKVLNALDIRFEEFIAIKAACPTKFTPRNMVDFVLGKEDKKQKEIKK